MTQPCRSNGVWIPVLRRRRGFGVRNRAANFVNKTPHHAGAERLGTAGPKTCRSPCSCCQKAPSRDGSLFLFRHSFSNGGKGSGTCTTIRPDANDWPRILSEHPRTQNTPWFNGLLPRSHTSLPEKGGHKNQCLRPFRVTFRRTLYVRVWITRRWGKVAASWPSFAACAKPVRSTPTLR